MFFINSVSVRPSKAEVYTATCQINRKKVFKDTHRFVKEQYWRILQQYPCDGQPLFLASGDHKPTFTDRCPISFRQALDRRVHIRSFCGLNDFRVTRIQPSVPDVMHDIRVEHRRVLRDDANRLAKTAQLHAMHVLVVDNDAPALWVVESEE